MWTIAQVADRDGVSKPVVSVRVKRFVEQHGLTVERDGQGRVARLNVAEYDALRGRYDDPSKAQAPSSRPPADEQPQSESYDEALRQKTWLETERRRIDLDQIRGKLVETASVAEGYDRAASAIREVLDRLDDHADDLAAVVARDGVRGLHTALKRLGADILGDIAEAIDAEARKLRAAIVEDVPNRPQ
jgi:hypothetical protein